jgi:hypothetical protein
MKKQIFLFISLWSVQRWNGTMTNFTRIGPNFGETSGNSVSNSLYENSENSFLSKLEFSLFFALFPDFLQNSSKLSF